MRFRTPELFLGALLASAIFAMGFLFASAPSFQRYSSTVESSGTQKPKEKSERVGDSETSDDRIAKYMLWLAILTGGLVFVSAFQGYFLLRADKSTRIAAKAADLSARAAVALELPLIRAEPIGFGLGIAQNANGEQFENFGLQSFEFSNQGRTKAFPIELHWGWVVSDKLPAIPEYKLSKPFELNLVMKETDGLRTLYIREFDMELSDGDTERITNRDLASQVRLWLYCRLVYEDFMYERHTAGFCWKYVDQFGGGRFIADATAAYNQRA